MVILSPSYNRKISLLNGSSLYCNFQVVGTSANLTLTVDNDSGGTYHCKASITGFPEIGAEGAIYIKGRPTIISHRTQFGVVGDNVRLECVVFSIPRPSHISWSFGGIDIDSTNQVSTMSFFDAVFE